MAEDLAAALADPDGAAVDIILDGVVLRAFVEDVAFQDCPFEGVVLERKKIIMQLGVIAAPVPLQEVIKDSVRFMVESSLQPYPALEIILTRFSS